MISPGETCMLCRYITLTGKEEEGLAATGTEEEEGLAQSSANATEKTKTGWSKDS